MPKIPTFTSEARPTAEVGSVKSNLQIPLSQTLANAVSPLTDYVVKKAIKTNDTQNKTEALRLGNDFVRELQTIEDHIANDSILGVNKEAAQAYHKEQTNLLINKFQLQTSNSASKTLFTNNALTAVQRGVFRIDNVIDKNVLLDLKNQVQEAETSLITQALFNNKDINVLDEFGVAGNVNAFDYATLQTNLTKLYTDAFSGKISNPALNSMINKIPSVVQGYQADKDIYDNPSFAYTELLKGKNSIAYPDLEVKQRTDLINKVETIMRQPLKQEFANVIFSLQDKGTEQPFDFNFAKKILPATVYDTLKAEYDIAKINAEDVKTINSLPLSETYDFIENKNFNTDKYTGQADRITQAKLKAGLIKVRNNKIKAMDSDPVKFITETNSKIKELADNYYNETNPDVKIANRKILTNALIDEQIRLNPKKSGDVKILTKQEVTDLKDQFTDPNITSENKLKLIETLKFTYGYENMGMIVNHLQKEETPETILMAISTDSAALAKDLFSSSSLEDLTKLAKQKGTTEASLQKLVAKQTEDFGQVVDSQGEGSESKAALMLRINESLLKVALVRMNKNVSAEDAVKSAANDFLNSYALNNDLTVLIPKTINKISIPVVAAENKMEAILLGIKDTSEDNYLDRLMGVDGYMHYASHLNMPNLSEEEVKKRVTYTIRNHSKWINNSDMTGAVLYAEFATGLHPVINSTGERVEFYFTHGIPNQDPKIKDTESVYPITGDVLPLLPDPNPFGDYDVDFQENFENENLNVSGLSKTEYDKQFIGMENQVANSNAIMSDAVELGVNINVGKEVILGDNIMNENSNKNLKKFITAVHDVESNKGKNLYNESSAAGDFQFKMFTSNNKKEGSAFQTGLQRVENLYKVKNKPIPSWVTKARKHNDPRKLTYAQQEELFLINLQQQKGTDELIKAMLNGDMEKAMQLYAQYHHTNKKVLNNKTIKEKFKKAYND